MSTVQPLFLLIGLMTGYIIVQLIIDTGVHPGFKASFLMFSIPPVLAITGWKLGGIVDKKKAQVTLIIFFAWKIQLTAFSTVRIIHFHPDHEPDLTG